jgi:hypothetical protein
VEQVATIRVVKMVLMPGYYVKMLSTRGQSACRTNLKRTASETKCGASFFFFLVFLEVDIRQARSQPKIEG